MIIMFNSFLSLPIHLVKFMDQIPGVKNGLLNDTQIEQCTIEIEIDKNIVGDEDSVVNLQQFSAEESISHQQLDSLICNSKCEIDSYSQEQFLSLEKPENYTSNWKGKPLYEMKHFVSENNECPAVNCSATHMISFKVCFNC